MTISITLPDETAHAVEAMALQTGVPMEQLLLQAIQAHFPPVDPELQTEFDAWNLASDQDAYLLNQREGLS